MDFFNRNIGNEIQPREEAGRVDLSPASVTRALEGLVRSGVNRDLINDCNNQLALCRETGLGANMMLELDESFSTTVVELNRALTTHADMAGLMEDLVLQPETLLGFDDFPQNLQTAIRETQQAVTALAENVLELSQNSSAPRM